MLSFGRRLGVTIPTNFGNLNGGWLRVSVLAVGFDQQMLGYACDAVGVSAKTSSSDFEGIVGVPFLRHVLYGGDAADFWMRAIGSPP